MATNGFSNGHSHVEAPMAIETPATAESNGNESAATPAVAAPLGIADVRGPLGLGSASLHGKVALVTGSGKQPPSYESDERN